MIPIDAIEPHHEDVAALCRRNCARRPDIIGSTHPAELDLSDERLTR